MLDGDAIFALSLGDGEHRADVSLLGELAAEAVVQAIFNAVIATEPLGGLP
jgi:L-aminopeptidase/D-esterase-like protein